MIAWLRSRLGRGSLRRRLIVFAAAFILTAILITGLVINSVLDRFVRGEVIGRLDLQIATIENALAAGTDLSVPRPPGERDRRGRPDGPRPPDGPRGAGRELDGPPFDRPGSGWTWQVETRGRLVAVSRFASETPIEPDRRDAEGPPHRLQSATGPGGQALVVRSRPVTVDGQTWRVTATAPLAAITRPLRDAALTVALTLGLLGAALVAGIVVQVRFGLAPLDRLRASLAAVRTGLAERIEGPQPIEIAPLADELNALIEQDAANLRQARLHVANLAHGLKTPLATLSAAAERMPDPAVREDFLGLTGLMDRRIRHHLRRARSAALGGPTRQRADLAGHGADLVAMLSKFHGGDGVTIETDLPAGLLVAVDAEDLDEMLGNLLDNACRHAKARVVLAAAREGRDAVVRICDDGPGLSPLEIEAVLQPGRRLDETMPGHGFGLPITAEIAELYGGRLTLGPAREGGVEARLALPMPADP